MTIDHERVDVKGRARPFEYDRMYTPNGVVIALDRNRHLVYTLGWSGAAPGGAAELAAVAIDRATSWTEFQAALSRWKMPTADFVYADVDGNTKRIAAGRVPLRPPGAGTMVTAGWRSERGWQGWRDLPIDNRVDDGTSAVLVVGASETRTERAAALLSRAGRRTSEELSATLTDVRSSEAARLLPLLSAVRNVPSELESARSRLTAWNGDLLADSPEAQTYLKWNGALRRLIAEPLVPSEFVSGAARRLEVVDVLTRPRRPWFDDPALSKRDAVLIQALAAAVRDGQSIPSADVPPPAAIVFQHPLAVFDPARRRFDVGPFPLRGSYDTLFAGDRQQGPTFRAIFDVSDWDRSRAVIAPGQSGAPSSPHYDDLAAVWTRGDEVPLPFSAASVQAATKELLRLTPR
jgi:penicillin amidase